MISEMSKRFLSFLLAMVMIVSMVPVQVFATETDEHNHDHGTGETVAQQLDTESETMSAAMQTEETQKAADQSGESEQMIQLRAEVAQYIETLKLSADMPDSVLKDLYLNLDSEMRMFAKNDVERMRYYGSLLSEEEQNTLMKEQNAKLVIRFYEVILSTYGPMMMAAVAQYSKSPVNGVLVEAKKDTDGSGTCSTDDATGAIVVTVTGYTSSNACGGTNNNSQKATVYIKNTSAKKATVTFKWVNSGLTVSPALTSGTHSMVMEANETLTIALTSPKGKKSGTLTLSDFTYEELQGSNDITFEYESNQGSVTLDGAAVTAGGVVSVPLSGATLKAIPASGNQFVAWVDGNDKPLSKDATYQFAPETPMTVKAVFSAGEPVFLVDNTYVVKGLNEALAKGKLVTLMNNATLPAGEYIIPRGYTLQIPYNDANTLCTTAPTLESYSGSGSYTLPTKYRELTMAPGAKIIVNGALSISARQLIGGTIAGVPWGPTSFIKMESGSSITVNDKANLYAWGYITGSGAVTIKNGGTVYEDFQVTSWRGGTNTSGMLDNKQRVFPMSQYYVQNVEVPMTLEAGATENGYMSISVTVLGTQKATVPFIGPNGMFNVTSGSITKDYNEAKDRLEITVNGSIQMKSLSMSMTGVGTIDSSKYDLPVNSNITVRVNSGSSIDITQNLAMLPGTEMYIADNANITLGKNTCIYFYDATEWVGKKFAHANSDVNPLRYAPGKTGAFHKADVDAKVYIEGTLDASQGYIYTTASGANITAAEGAKVILKPGTQTVTYQVTQTGSDGKTITYCEVPITPAKLKNADNTYTETKALPYGEYTYTNGVWHGTCLHVLKEEVKKAATCTVDGEKRVYCACGGYDKVEAIPAVGHDYKAEVTAPTCEAAGYTTHTCATCSDSYIDTPVAATGHNMQVTTAKVEPGCESVGHEAILTCANNCGKTEGGAEIPAKGHNMQVTTPKVEPGCESVGYEAILTCANSCGKTEGGAEISAKGHNMQQTAAKVEPGCESVGYEAVLSCANNCGKTEGGTEIAAKGHSWNDGVVTTPPTEEAEGVKTFTCSSCGGEKTESIPKLDHVHDYNHNVVVTDPTCTDKGYTTKTCRCGDVKVEDYVDALGHTEVVDNAVAPDCVNTGLTAGKHCEVCGEVLEAQTVVDALGHGELVEEELIPAMCEEDGHEAGKICIVCNEYVEGGAVLPATGHKLYQYAAKIPTYTMPGWDAYERCSQCAHTTYVEIPKVETPHITTYESFIQNLMILEQAAQQYALEHPGTDPLNLVIKYIRTGVERYNSGSWNIMAGYEDAGFRKFADEQEDAYNVQLPRDQWVAMSSLKYIDEFTLPNGDRVDFGHMFGTMDITYHNNNGVDHADVGGWSGDLVDLLTTSSGYIGENYSSDLETTVKFIKENYLFKMVHVDDKFSATDWYGDADGFYLMQMLAKGEYKPGDLVALMQGYFTASLNAFDRADFLIRNRFNGVSTRQDLRTAVYYAYTGNKTISTLEATRDFKHSGTELNLLRKAVCYAFADYLCETAGDYVDAIENPYYEVFDSKSADLAPGITQQLNFATSADGQQMAYYIATADLRNPNVKVYANYASRDPQNWSMARVLDSANAMQELYGNPESEEYVENFNVIASINAGGYDMSDGDPGGLLVMHGQMYKNIGSGGFFAITKEGKAILGATSEWNQYADQVEEAIGGFGTLLVKDGKIAITQTSDYYSNRAPRSAVGITATGKVVFMVLDGRQEPFSCGGSMIEIAQIMFDAGCVDAINLDGGGSSTFVARQPGDEALKVMNRPSDGAPRSVSTALVMASTAPSSTAFDHANLQSATKHVTKGTSLQITAEGISATGNAAELPEGTSWVIDAGYANWASIDENGLFTAKDRLGEVEVKLMLGDKVVGHTTISIVEPDQIYFTKSTLSAVYGQTIVLPVKVLYQGKEVTVNTSDVVFTMNADVGSVDGFNFTAKEGTIKNAKITAALAANADIKAIVNVNLFKQGENSFDFDQATSGDRMLAWLRTVSNATTDDDVTYTVLDAEKDMVTNYVLAMDMSQIPVPAHLEDLIYMLPGADMADASAWGFLMQLAERISPLTTVTPKIVFDSRVDVDISEMKLLNEYFEITAVNFDESTNTMSLKLNWIDQTAALDPATANPLCMVSGIKVTPKADADWGSKDMLNIVHYGDISYDIYMRASGLYTFAQKPENQQTFGLYDYVNPNNSSDRGGHFMSTYAEFKDSYTLVNVAKEGWVNEAGGFAYYVDGQRLTGVQNIDGVFYDFGENGINVGQSKYTGLFYDEAAQVYRYSYIGVLTAGWQMIENEWYYFDSATMAAVTGKRTIKHVPYEFEETGKLVSGVWMNVFTGYRYYYGPDYVRKGWYQVGDDMYYFRDAFAVSGDQKVASQEISTSKRWYHFNENGVCEGLLTGIVEEDGKLYYVENGKPADKGLFKFGDYHYCTIYDGSLIVNQKYYVWKLDATAELSKGHYEFDAQGRLLGSEASEEGGVSGIVNKDGKLYYYENGKPTEKGLFKLNGDYYVAQYDGSLIVNQKYYVWKMDATGDLPKGHYEFGADGKMLQGIVDKDGVLYYYENGNAVEKGLFKMDGYYYAAMSKGLLAVNQKYYAWKVDASSELPKGNYEFGPDGKMYQGIVDKNGVLYYYENGVGVEKGLFLYEDGSHYFAQSGGKLIVGQTYYAWKLDSSALLPKANYEFAADGKVVGSCLSGEIVNKNGVLYYYENGKPTEKGLFKFNDDYYVAQYDGTLIVNQKYYVWKMDVTGDLPKSHYEFGADGKMLQGIVDKNGVLYYYENGKPTEKGLFKLNGEYYVAQYDGKLIVDQKYYVWKHDATSELTNGHYEFDAEGKMLQGIVDKNGVLYYYENGKPVEKGLFVFNGDHYYSQYDGTLIVGKNYYAWKLHESSELPKATYLFDASGKVVGAKKNGEIVNIDGVLYYYESGKPVDKGLFIMDGYYYFTLHNGQLVVDQDYYVWKDNEYLMVKTYTFNELGQIIK